ncbi:hypothetical protein BDV12DRAFT_163289 [Aspergillus spectabilis]
MSRLVLSSAARRISRPRPRATVPAISSSVPTLSFSASFCHSSYRTPAILPAPKRSPRVRSTFDSAPQFCLRSTQQRSPFSSSAATPAAQVTQNPKVGEDGNTLMVEISARAAKVRWTPSYTHMRSFVSHSLGSNYRLKGVGTYFSGCGKDTAGFA